MLMLVSGRSWRLLTASVAAITLLTLSTISLSFALPVGVSSVRVSGMLPHPPISIGNDADFMTQGWPGSGTPEDPFVIEHLNITCDQVCISVQSVATHFVIRDCFLKSLRGGAMCCVEFDGVTDGVVADCFMDSGYSYYYGSGDVIFSRYGYGARVSYSENCTLRDNTIYNNYYGVSLAWSNSCGVIDNGISKSWIGIHLTDSCRCLLDRNDLSLNRYGAMLTRADSSVVVNQTMNGLGHGLGEMGGVGLSESRGCEIHDNTFCNSGLSIELPTPLGRPSLLEHWNHSVTGNTVNGKPLGYFWNCSNTAIDATSNGQVILGGCRNVTVRHAMISNSSAAVQLGHCMNVTLADSVISNDSLRGVSLLFCEGCSVVNCTITDNFVGIYPYHVKDVRVVSNALLGNWRSLYAWYVDASSFCNNSIGNAHRGVYLEHGLFCSIENNLIADCQLGIDLWFSEHCQIVGNGVFNSSQVGIRLTANSQYNHVYYNSIGWNALNGEDHGSSNIWDDGLSRGNNWSDYSGYGWYEVPGTAGSRDRYPSRLPSSTSSGQVGQPLELVALIALAITALTVSAAACFLYRKPQ